MDGDKTPFGVIIRTITRYRSWRRALRVLRRPLVLGGGKKRQAQEKLRINLNTSAAYLSPTVL